MTQEHKSSGQKQNSRERKALEPDRLNESTQREFGFFSQVSSGLSEDDKLALMIGPSAQAAQRSQVALDLQRSHGNRYVQSAVSRAMSRSRRHGPAAPGRSSEHAEPLVGVEPRSERLPERNHGLRNDEQPQETLLEPYEAKPTNLQLFQRVPDGDAGPEAGPSESVGSETIEGTSPSGEEAGAATSGLPPEAAERLIYARLILSRVEPLTAAQEGTLEDAIPGSAAFRCIQQRDEKRSELESLTEDLVRMRAAFNAPDPLHGAPPPEEELDMISGDIEVLGAEVELLDTIIRATLDGLGLDNERQLVNLVSSEFPQLFVDRGEMIARAILDRNEEIAERERDRYSTAFGIPLGNTYDVSGLRSAASELAGLQAENREMLRELETARTDVETTMPSHGVPESEEEIVSSSYHDLTNLQDRIRETEAEYGQRRETYATQYPILLRVREPELSVIASGSVQQIEDLIGGKVQEILDNIDETRDNLGDSLKIWDLPVVMRLTMQDLGVEPTSVLGEVIRERAERERSEEFALNIALAAIGITASIIAGLASGGLAWVAIGVSVGVSAYQLSESAETYSAELAASNVALDPDVADISRNNPELGWVILDLIALGLDAAAVVRVFTALRGPAQAMMRSGDVTDLARVAADVLPNAAAADRVMATAARRANIAQRVDDIIEAGGTTFRSADLDLIEGEVRWLSRPGIADVVANLRANEMIVPLTDDALVHYLGAERAHDYITRGYLRANGFYDNETARLFVRPGRLEGVQSTIVHEVIHYFQDMYQLEVHGFRAEFQANVLARDYLRTLVEQAGPDAVPARYRSLARASDEQIMRHIERAYGYETPLDFDAAEVTREILETVRIP